MTLNPKRINRGLVLGAALVAGTAVYVIAENAAFNKNKTDIEAAAADYITGLCEANMEYNNEDKGTKPLTDYINNTWTYADDVGNSWSYVKSELLGNIDSSYSEEDRQTHEGSGIESLDCNVSKVKVSKYGRDYALVTLSYSVNIVFNGMPEIMLDCGYASSIADYVQLDGYYDESTYYYSYPEDVKIQATLESIDGDTFLMKNTDSGWKVAGWTEGWVYATSMDLLEEGTTEASDSTSADTEVSADE